MRNTRTLFAVVAILMCSAVAAAAQTWQVQSADWGAGNRRQDVTNTVRRLVNGGNFKANNQNLGVDPAVGKDKTLRIIGRDQRGGVRTFTYNEGQTVNASQFFGGNNWGGGGGGWGGNSQLRIVQANYRAVNGGGGRNVTSRLQDMVRNNRLDVTVNNSTMGGDPAKGQSKQLYVVYEFRGQNRTTTVGENGQLRLP
jgi:hypothetical protein